MAIDRPSIDKDDITGSTTPNIGSSCDVVDIKTYKWKDMKQKKINAGNGRIVTLQQLNSDVITRPKKEILKDILELYGFKDAVVEGGNDATGVVFSYNSKPEYGFSISLQGTKVTAKANCSSGTIYFKVAESITEYQTVNIKDGVFALNSSGTTTQYDFGYVAECMDGSSTYLWDSSQNILSTISFGVSDSPSRYIIKDYNKEEKLQLLNLECFKIQNKHLSLFSFSENKENRHYEDVSNAHAGNYIGEGPIWNGVKYPYNSYFGAFPSKQLIPLFSTENYREDASIVPTIKTTLGDYTATIEIRGTEWIVPLKSKILLFRRSSAATPSITKKLPIIKQKSVSQLFNAMEDLFYEKYHEDTSKWGPHTGELLYGPTGALIVQSSNPLIGYDSSDIYLALSSFSALTHYGTNDVDVPTAPATNIIDITIQAHPMTSCLLSLENANGISLGTTNENSNLSWQQISNEYEDYIEEKTFEAQYDLPEMDYASSSILHAEKRDTVLTSFGYSSSSSHGITIQTNKNNNIKMINIVPRISLFQSPYSELDLYLDSNISDDSWFHVGRLDNDRYESTYLNFGWNMKKMHKTGLMPQFSLSVLEDVKENDHSITVFTKDGQKTLLCDGSYINDFAYTYYKGRISNENATSYAYWVVLQTD